MPFNDYLGEFYDRLLLAALIRTMYRSEPRFTVMLRMVEVRDGRVVLDDDGNAIPIDTRQKWENGDWNPHYMKPIIIKDVLETIDELKAKHKQIYGREYD